MTRLTQEAYNEFVRRVNSGYWPFLQVSAGFCAYFGIDDPALATYATDYKSFAHIEAIEAYAKSQGIDIDYPPGVYPRMFYGIRAPIAPVIKPTDTVVHVNRGTIDSNRKHNKSDPVLKVQKGKTGKGTYGRTVEVLDQDGRVAATFFYDETGILSCGAKVVLVAPFGARVTE